MATYRNMVNEIFHSVGQTIGIHVMLLVIEHALWTTRQKYEEANLISFSEDGVLLDKLDDVDLERAQLITHEFLMSIIKTLGKLVGIQLARQLAGELLQNDLEVEA